jgi:hypothetical protein
VNEQNSISTINKSGELNGANLGRLLFDENLTRKEILIRDCTINILIIKTNLPTLITIVECKIQHLIIKPCEIEEVSIANSEIDHLQASEFKCARFDVIFSTIKNSDLTASFFEQLTLNDSKAVIGFSSSKTPSNISIYEGKSELFFYSVEIDSLTISTRALIKSFEIENSTLRTVAIGGNSIVENFSVNSSEVSNLFLQNLSKGKTGSRLIFNDLSIDNLKIDEYSNTGDFKFLNSDVKKSVEITGCDLTKAIFSSIEWAEAEISFSKSLISDSSFSNIGWNDNYQIKEYKEITAENEVESWDIMESYRQLKSSYQKQSNLIEADMFRSHELQLYYKIIKYYTFDGFKLTSRQSWKDFKTYIQTFLILWTSKKGSNFGRSIFLPLWRLFQFHSILFVLFIWRVDGSPVKLVTPAHHNWADFWEGVRLFIYTINPAHSYEINDVPIYGVSDTLMRISAAYFIYYFLKATRKFHIT